MPEQPAVGDVLKDISADISTIVKGEIELAKAELVPQAKSLGVGGALLAGAGVFGAIALNVLFLCLGFVFTNLFWGRTATPVGAFGWGFLCAVGVYLLIAGILALIGIRKLKVSSPDKTLTQGRRSVDAVKRAVSAGMQDVKLIASRGAKQFTTNTKGELLTVYRGQAAPKEAVPQTFPPASDTHVASTGDASTTAGSSTTGGATAASGR